MEMAALAMGNPVKLLHVIVAVETVFPALTGEPE